MDKALFEVLACPICKGRLMQFRGKARLTINQSCVVAIVVLLIQFEMIFR